MLPIKNLCLTRFLLAVASGGTVVMVGAQSVQAQAAAAGTRQSSQAAVQDSSGKTRRDSLTKEQRELIREVSRDARSVSRRLPRGDSTTRATLNEAAIASAFASPEAQTILLRAREARERQDSALRSYQATFTQRISVGMGARKLGLEKLLFRGDNVATISWRRDVGVWVKPLGSRVTVPIAREATGDIVDAVTIPYFPGRDQLWFPSSSSAVTRIDVDDREIIHPLARGAERWYRYETGDSVDIRLPDSRVIHLRELRITARKPEWKTFVGSFWFDIDGGQLVRAAYRMAAEMNIWSMSSEEAARDAAESRELGPVRDSIMRARLPRELYEADSIRRAKAAAAAKPGDDDVPGWVSATFQPARASLDAITVEYALYGGKFWLPRSHSATATVDLMFMRIPFRMDEKFTYESVDGDFSLPPLPPRRSTQAEKALAANDSVLALKSAADSARSGEVVERGSPGVTVTVGTGGSSKKSNKAENRDSLNTSRFGAAMVTQCARDSVWTRVETRYEGAVRVAYQMPCNMEQLSKSAALPPESASDKDLFDLTSQNELLAALGLSLQSPWAPQLPRLRIGSDLFRYNRVEGLSAGVEVSQTLGAGFTARAVGRIGHADLHANGLLELVRTNGLRTVTARLYHDLRASNPEWAAALSPGPSLPALLFGRDEGFYYRAMGASLGEVRQQRRGLLQYELFLERQWTAGDSTVVNTFSLAKALTGKHFGPNMLAEPGSYAGVRGSISRIVVDHPFGLRLTSEVRGEAATGTFAYARTSIESTISRHLGPTALALTASVGSSAGRVPVQRFYQVGGLHTVRGELPGTQIGNAYWFTRAEVGTRQGAFRPVVFHDIGWAGSRKEFGSIRPQQGVGIGLGLLDGLFRFDIARGLHPFKGWRSDFYLEAPI